MQARPRFAAILNLYGQQGLDHGVLHNHMRLQPVVHVDAGDGKVARLRSRALQHDGCGRQIRKMDGRRLMRTTLIKEDGSGSSARIM